MDSTLCLLLESWKNTEGNVNSTESIIDWIQEKNETTEVKIKEDSINDSTFWFYDDYNGEILNRKRSFFSIKGIRLFENEKFVKEQPIIYQPEIGYLGIICKKIDGVLNFLMQAKIEPGNVNCVQISPTIQATKSNFTRAHGGKLPLYFEYFESSSKYKIIYDQIQSEQASRFYKKRNRNIIIIVDEEIPIYDNFKWMTLGQIKQLMKIDNIVNMDTRTVLSGIPYIMQPTSDAVLPNIKKLFTSEAFYNSIFVADCSQTIPRVYNAINNYKMFHDVMTVETPLNQLTDWVVDERGITCKNKADFMVKYYDISIEGREVQHWTQPLFKATGEALFVLVVTEVDNMLKFVVSLKSEIGSFDKIELGPSIQHEHTVTQAEFDVFENMCYKKLDNPECIWNDVMLSEEGGRFYHEQNRNVIMYIDYKELKDLPDNYFLMDFRSLNYLIQVNNCLNIQLRNLLSLLDI